MNIIKSLLKLIKSFFTDNTQKPYSYSYNTDKNVNTTVQLDPLLKKAADNKLPTDLSEKKVVTTVTSNPVVEVGEQPAKKKGRKPSTKKK